MLKKQHKLYHFENRIRLGLYRTIINFIGMDLRMTPYSCLATGNQVGIIEFVHNAKTVYNIQRQGTRLAAMQFDSTQLYKWIKEVSQKVRF